MRTKAWLAMALAGALTGSVALATTLEQLDMSAMVAQATVAVVGEVSGTQTVTSGNDTYTVATITVNEVIFGTDATTLTVNVPGGSRKIGRFNIGTVYPGAPVLIDGTSFVLLLNEDSSHGGYSIVGFDQGAIPVAPDQTVSLNNKAVPTSDAVRELRQMRQQRNQPASEPLAR